MHDTPGAILRQIARTAVLVGGLGLLLFGGVSLLAEREGARWMIGLALAAPLAALVGWVVLDALRSGVFPMRFSSPTRDGQPVAYWCSVGWFATCGGLLVALAVWCAARLLEG